MSYKQLLFFDPSILNIDEYDSTFTVKVNSNSTWSYNTGELSWVTVNPKIGSGSGQITIRVSANSTNQSRSTKLVFNCGTSGNTFSLDVIQAMNSCSFSAIPNPIMIGANGGVIDTLKINSSSTWFRCDNESDISTDNNLIGGPLVKDRIGVLTIKPNSSFIPRILKLKFCYCNNSKEYEVIINQKGSTLDKTPPWKIIKTAKIHTVVIEKSVQSDIFGKPIEIGDWIGFFYKDDTSSCAGEGQWDAKQDLPIIIYGDDPLTSIIDGFKVSQQFLIKIRRYHTFNDIKLEASYYPANGNPYNSTNKFSDGGYSGIYFVKADNCVPVPVHFGNSLISSYIKPLDSNMLNIFKPFSSSIRTVVDDQGNVTLPWNNVNTIGNWNYRKAYKLSSATEFTISDVFCGDKIIPENEIISIRANEPVFIPYLRDNVKSVDSEFNKYKDKILWMKDENLDLLLLPQINLVWGDLEPFKGYVLKARVPFDLVYSPNFKSTDLEIRSRFEYKNGDFFKSEFTNTNNATALVIPDNLATLKFRIGDELAVFNTLNQVCGSTIYSGGHFVLKMWGDNSFTESKDGLLDYEDLKFKKYSKNSNLIEDVKFSFTDKIPSIFDANKMFIVSTLEESEINIIRIYPNPVSEKVYIEGIVDIESIDVLGTLGNIVKIIYNTEMKPNLEVDLSLLTSGTYFFKFNAFKNKAAQFRKVLISR
ncbi:MAG: T9SS type A sorting domain-containing protein [Saprospiraceae bacterium]|nr:T9SS type A sorting domain-containing protein [Candidatus Vicinibacter affinis]